MGGSSNPVSRIKKGIKKTVRAPKHAFDAARGIIKGEDIGANIKKFGSAAATLGSGGLSDQAKAFGVAPIFTDPAGQIGGAIVKSKYDDPKAAAKASAEQAVAAGKAQQSQLADIKKRKKQGEAEAEAGKDLLKSRQKQSRSKTGRRSTILTDKLGGSGGARGGRKSLLGL